MVVYYNRGEIIAFIYYSKNDYFRFQSAKFNAIFGAPFFKFAIVTDNREYIPTDISTYNLNMIEVHKIKHTPIYVYI